MEPNRKQWEQGDKLKLSSPIHKNSIFIRIVHNRELFPSSLEKGSDGEVISFDNGELFVRFLIKDEKDYFKDCFFTFIIKKEIWWQVENLTRRDAAKM